MSQTPFSYAQAAKGQFAAQPAPQPTTSPAPPSVSSQGKDDATTTSTAATVLSTTSGDNDAQESSKQGKTEDESSVRRQEFDPSTKEPAAASRAISDAASNNVGNGDSRAETSRSVTEEKSHRSPSRNARSNDGETRKGRKGKKSRQHEKEGDADKAQAEKEEKEPPKPIILSEAPIPSVNIWHKRREAQASKTQVTPAANTQNTAPAQNGPVDEPKKRVTTEEVDAPAGAENSTSGERAPQRKSVDFSRTADQAPRRSGPRGTRAHDKDEKTGAESLPSVADSALWPDVKSAVAADEKKKPQEKTERTEKEAQDETGPSKRSKKEWVAIPYVPTVNFQTPMPQRSSKPRGGARGGREAGTTRAAHSNAGSANAAPVTEATGDKAQSTTNTAPAKEGRPPEGSGAARANSLPPAAKRQSIDASFTKDARKPSAPTTTDIRREPGFEAQSQSGAAKTENGRVGRPDFSQAGSEQQPQSASRSFSDHRREAGFKGYEASIPTPKEQSFVARDRPEGQGRGRGGYRARGGHNASVGGHQQAGFSANGQYPVHALQGRQTGPYSPPAHQNAFGGGYGAGLTRGGGRGSGRGSSGTGGWVKANGAGPGRMAPAASYDFQMPQYGAYPPMQVPAVHDPSVIPLLTAQIEYYLSVDNLCKDVFLRKHMDSQGFVPFDLIAGFQRVKTLAPDAEHIRAACEVSDKMDFVIGEDGRERLRLRDLWDRFVLPMDDRDEEAKNEGPASFYVRSKHSRPPFGAPMFPVGYHNPSANMYPGNYPGEEQMYQQQQQPYMNGGHYDAGVNGGDMNGHHYIPETPLSAAVPEFSPSVQQVPFTLEGATTFTDEQVETLNMVVELASSKSPSQAEAPVINGTDSASAHAQTNGVSQDISSDMASVQSPSVVPRTIVWREGHEPPKSGRQTTQQRYVDFRKETFAKRHAVKAGDTSKEMKILYKFWEHFLLTDFNPRMYEEFRSCAMEDAGQEVPATFGLDCLLRYYKELVHGDKKKPWSADRPVPEIINLHHHSAQLMNPSHGADGETRI